MLQSCDASWALLDHECLQSDASVFESQEGQAYSIYHTHTDAYKYECLDFELNRTKVKMY